SSYFDREKEEGVTQEITLRVLKELAKLAGDADFQPQLAGRRWKTGEDAIDLGNGNGNGPSQSGSASNNRHAHSSAPAELSRHVSLLLLDRRRSHTYNDAG